MQNFHFRSVDEMLDAIPEDELGVTLHLRELVLEMIPDVHEHLAYNVPYYRRHSNICFIWPGSVGWGGKTLPGVRFGFTNGNLLEDTIGFLDRGDRKQVYWKDYFTSADVEDALLRAYIVNAVEIDTMLWEKKRHCR